MLTGARLREKVTPLAKRLWALGDPYRLASLHLLVQEPMTFDVIVRKLKISPSLALHHLRILERAGWVTRSKFGKLVTYYLAEDRAKLLKNLL